MSRSVSRVLLAAGLATIILLPLYGRDRGVSMNSHGPIRTCSNVEFRIHGTRAAQDEQRVTAPAAQVPVFEYSNPEHGNGLNVSGWDKDQYEILACRAAVSPELLGQITVGINAGRVNVNGPNNDDWTVYLIVHAPRKANMNLTTTNGPIAVRDIVGTLKVHTVNGPIALDNVSGTLDLRATNGPISFVGGAGRATVNTENGPISIELAGRRWEGEGLEAHAHNGPISVSMAEDYQARVAVDLGDWAPFGCNIDACRQYRGVGRNGQRRIEFGSGSGTIRLSTVNGPVAVRGKKTPTI